MRVMDLERKFSKEIKMTKKYLKNNKFFIPRNYGNANQKIRDFILSYLECENQQNN